jgi:predicted lactoylglutathione lyase
VNLPVKNLNKSVEFFTKLGFRFNPQFTDETANFRTPWIINGESVPF